MASNSWGSPDPRGQTDEPDSLGLERLSNVCHFNLLPCYVPRSRSKMNAMMNDREALLGGRQESAPKADLGTILVIEDDPRMQKVLRRIFAEENYSIEIAGDGQTGLDLFRARRPAAVVLDLILAQISGRELCQTMKSIAGDTPVIVLSAITEVVD